MDATPFIFRSARMKEPIDYDPVESRKRFRRTSRPLTEREERYLANWDEAERTDAKSRGTDHRAGHAELRRTRSG